MTTIRFTKWLILINGGVPLALLGWDAYRGQLGANPVNYAIRTTGMLALIFLALSLLVTPVRLLSGWNEFVLARRVLGLYAFFYAACHFLLFFALDQSGSVSSTLSEMVKRKYLVVGSIGLFAMVPLAITSANAMVRLLGSKRWHALHQLAYVAAIAGALHYYMLVKADVTKPLIFAGVFAALLAFRYLWQFHQPTKAPVTTKATAAKTATPSTSARPPTFWRGRLKVARVFDETPDAKSFRLVAPDGARLPFDYLPGQYLNLSLTVDGKPVHRSYTIASAPTQRGHCELTVKREAVGVASRHLHDMIHEGDVIDVGAPAGRFTFTGREADRIVLLGAGVGITPLMSVIRYLTDVAWPGEITLIYGGKSTRELIFRHELDDLSSRFPNLRFYVTLTRETDATWTGRRGRITAALVKEIEPDVARHRAHVCGPPELLDPTRALLRALGVPDENVFFETFESPRAAAADAMPQGAVAATQVAGDAASDGEIDGDANGVRVAFKPAGKAGVAAAGETVLDVADAVGVDVPYECRSGICGTCKVRLLAGHVTMATRDGLSRADEAAGHVLACQAVPTEAVVIEA